MVSEKIIISLTLGGNRFYGKIKIEYFLYFSISGLKSDKVMAKPHLMLINESGAMVNGIYHFLLIIMGEIGFGQLTGSEKQP